MQSWSWIFLTWVDNLARRLVPRRMDADVDKHLGEQPGNILLDGAVEQWERVARCRDLLVNFDLYRPGKKRRCFFEEGFMRIGDYVSPPGNALLPARFFNQWRRTGEPVPACAEFAPGKTALFCNPLSAPVNPAFILFSVAGLLRICSFFGVRIEDALVLHGGEEHGTEIENLRTGLFDMKNIGDLRGTYLFRDAILAPGSLVRANVFGGDLLVQGSESTVRRRVLAAFGIEPRSRVSRVDRITWIARRDYRRTGKSMSVLARKVSNEDDVITSLRGDFPGVEVSKAYLEDLPIKEQLRLIHETDVLIGMHGAGLIFTAMLPPNAGVLELFPAHFFMPHYFNTFYYLVINNDKHYRRWINLNPGRELATEEYLESLEDRPAGDRYETQRDFTEVPPRAVARKLRALQRRIHAAADDRERSGGSR